MHQARVGLSQDAPLAEAIEQQAPNPFPDLVRAHGGLTHTPQAHPPPQAIHDQGPAEEYQGPMEGVHPARQVPEVVTEWRHDPDPFLHLVNSQAWYSCHPPGDGHSGPEQAGAGPFEPGA